MKQTSRLTIDMSADEHSHLKTASALLGISMREFMLQAAFEKMSRIEDAWLAERASQALKDLASAKRDANMVC